MCKCIVDYGAFKHMMNNIDVFTNMQKWPSMSAISHVIIVDGETREPIEGEGTLWLNLPNNTTLEIENVI